MAALSDHQNMFDLHDLDSEEIKIYLAPIPDDITWHGTDFSWGAASTSDVISFSFPDGYVQEAMLSMAKAFEVPAHKPRLLEIAVGAYRESLVASHERARLAWIVPHSDLLRLAWDHLHNHGFFHTQFCPVLDILESPAHVSPVGWVSALTYPTDGPTQAYAATVTIPTYGSLFLGIVDSMVTLLHEAAHIYVINKNRVREADPHDEEWREAYRRVVRLLFPRAAHNADADRDLCAAQKQAHLDDVAYGIVASCYKITEGARGASGWVNRASITWEVGDSSYEWPCPIFPF